MTFVKKDGFYKIKNIYLLLLYIFFCLLCFQKEVVANHLDSCFVNNDYAIKERFFDSEKIAVYKKQKAFNYEKLPPKPNPFQQFLFWLSQKIDGALGSKTSGNIWFYLKYILVFVALYIVLKTFLKLDVNHLFFKQEQQRKQQLKHSEFEENIHELDFEKMITEAVAEKRYRLAVRLHYLKTLKTLTDKDFIHWKINKTNVDYMREMQTKPLHSDFRQLTHWFDYVWYGNFELNAESFADIEAHFLAFEKAV